MPDNDEPIIATRPSREPAREEAPPLWRLVLALGVGLAIVLALVWWWTGRPSDDGASTAAQSDTSALESQPAIPVEQAPAPRSLDLDTGRDVAPDTSRDIAQAPLPAPAQEPATAADRATSENAADGEAVAIPEVPDAVPDNAVQTTVTPATVSVRLMSPDPQVQFELRGPLDSSPALTSKAGEIVDLAPGTYRVVASGARLETFEQKVKFEGESPREYTIELCAVRERERADLAGRIVEERPCGSAAQCESMFMVLSELAEEFVKDREFRAQQCAKWRAKAVPEGKWTLDTNCGGATLATTCRIEIAAGGCTFAEPQRSARGTACPRVELK